MRQELQLFMVDPSTSITERIDLFKDESITITQKIQDARDIGNIFTDFSQTFSVPASKNNNKLFKHYYRTDIDIGFNANNKYEAKIELNNMLFRKGYLALQIVTMKGGEPSSYKITFYGETVDIKKQLKDLTLREIYSGYTNLNHDYTAAVVRIGFQSSLSQGELCYPAISHTNRFYYDTSDTNTGTRNLYYSGNSTADNRGVQYTDLKPAIRIKNIIQRIISETSLVFDETKGFFKSIANPEYTLLYMWLSRERGQIGNDYSGTTDNSVRVIKPLFTGFAADPPNSNYGNPGFAVSPGNPHESQLNLSNPHNVVTITSATTRLYLKCTRLAAARNGERVRMEYQVTSNQVFSMFIRNESSEQYVASRTNVTGQQTITYTHSYTNAGEFNSAYYNVEIHTTDPNFSCSQIFFIKYQYQTGQNYYRTNASRSSTMVPNNLLGDEELDIPVQMPDMKVLDFLRGIFKAFNLTAFYQDDGTILVQTLDDYYAAGTDIDVSDYIDKKQHTSAYPIPYQEIAFRYKGPSTFMAINFQEINGYKFGDLESTSKQTEVQQTDRGSKYVVELPFDKMLYEPLKNKEKVCWGWSVDKDQNAVKPEAPLFFYRRSTNCSDSGAGIAFYNGTQGAFPAQLFTYCRPANTYFNKTLNFNAEVDEFTGLVKTGSLFQEYYFNYVSDLFDRQRRLLKFTAYLPVGFLLTFKLNDCLIIDGVKYQINSIKTNLTTGKSELELYNKLSTYD